MNENVQTPGPVDRLRARVATLGAPLCLGIDPHPDALPDGLPHDVRGIEAFARGVLEAGAPHAAAIKVNVAFFEAFGSAGLAALERLRADVPADHVLILDAKRGDMRATAERYAQAIFGHLGADGVTLSPYLGEDAIEPFVAFPGRIVYVLARTSNPSAPRLQHLRVRDGERTLAEEVGSWVTERWPRPEVGLVVGATAPTELQSLRERLPEPAFLVPGLGAQGGDIAAAVRACHGSRAPGLVNVSRSIAGASTAGDWPRAVAAAAERWRASLAEASATLAI
ncbi:MAG TPA: orotidine-5'-phosphate decarboxylase [Candidatus Limnocylindrales bacterium]|nr:orotidine-5'-phosphate decarboxylase [Candidatus Limnocylindrales bacterium]